MKREEIFIRDPFVLPMNGQYLMTGTYQAPNERLAIYGFITKDFENFEGPICLFDPPKDFWADRDFWAPEIHAYRGKYYMFVSFRSPHRRRATQILVADEPIGPYRVQTAEPVTPREWHCLDGTLHVDDSGKPWIVYVREFVQMVDGEMYAQRLKEDLSDVEGEPQKLFCATWAPWCVTNEEGGMPFDAPGGFITDGPFLFRQPNGTLGMLWSSFCKDGYCQAVCYSPNGMVTGPWKQMDTPLISGQRGHGMLFTTFEEELMFTLHDKNTTSQSNAVFLKALIDDDGLHIDSDCL